MGQIGVAVHLENYEATAVFVALLVLWTIITRIWKP